MNCTFRRLTLADLSAVLEMNHTFRDGFITAEGATAFLSDDRNWLWAGITEERIIALHTVMRWTGWMADVCCTSMRLA